MEVKISKNYFTNIKNFAIAVSGGLDSMALAFLVKKQFPKLKFTALIVDHKFRRESTKEANEVKKYLEKNDVNAVVLTPLTINHQPSTISEESLRNLRYNLITKYCKENNIKNVFLAHHKDDNVETFLMRLERGSGLQGLSAIKEKSSINGINFIRPLLNYSKNDLKNFLIENKIKWFEDSSNQNQKFTRNKIRTALQDISDYDLLSNRINSVIENISRANDFIEIETENFFKKLCKNIFDNIYEISLNDFINLHSEIAFRIIKKILLEISQNIRKTKENIIENNELRFDSIKNIYLKICIKKNFSMTYNFCEIMLENDKIYFFPELSKISSFTPIGKKNLDEFKKKNPKLKNIHYKLLRTLDNNYFNK
ncbi:MAG: tRNA lysidine(34) synthetase TilS [Rickettsiales bacterium]|nr:tRNA lysidine(34) synthetase TilS [Rickettsiales bacterium]